MKQHLDILNQLFLMEQKLTKENKQESYARFLSRIHQAFSDMDYTIQNPLHEKYTDTRTDLEANIVGEATQQLVVTQVIKPIVFHHNQLLQKGVVIVENQ